MLANASVQPENVTAECESNGFQAGPLAPGEGGLAVPAAVRQAYEQKIQGLEREIGLLREKIQLLLADKYGHKSERHAAETGQKTLPFFDEAGEAPAEAVPTEEDGAEVVAVPAHSRTKPKRKPLPPELPRVEVIHDLPAAEKVCDCGCALTRIGEEVSEQLDVVPARIQVIRHIRPKYACRQCEGQESGGAAVKIAPAPEQLIPKGLPTAGTLAHVLTAKFADALPFYRQEEQFGRLGIELGRGTMCSWAMQTAAACRCLLDLLLEQLRAGPVIQVDETPVQVLNEPGRKAQTKSYMWVFRGGPPGETALLFRYSPTRAGSVAAEVLGGYQGYVQSDGYAGYDFLDHCPGVRHLGCLVHARRHFVDVVKAAGKSPGAGGKGSAQEILKLIGEIYRIENECRELAPDWEKVQATREAQARPVLEQIQQKLLDLAGRTPPHGLLGKAVAYALGQWERIVSYLEDGRLQPDNNLVENAIRPFTVGRKNWLFHDRPEGAAAGATIYSLIETAKANNLEPFAYLCYLFECLPATRTQESRRQLLPWNVNRSAQTILRRPLHESSR